VDRGKRPTLRAPSASFAAAVGFVNGVRIDGGTVAFTIELTTPACPVCDQMKEQAHRAVLSLPGAKAVDLTMTSQVRATRSEQKDTLLPLVKNIVPIDNPPSRS